MNRMDAIDTGSAEASAFDALLEGRLHDPFGVLGPHETPKGHIVRAFLPGALSVEARSKDGALIAPLAASLTHSGVFTGLLAVCPCRTNQIYSLINTSKSLLSTVSPTFTCTSCTVPSQGA